MDETGVFFKDTTRKTFHIKGEDCPGGKRSKERITAAFCASLTGEKLEPLIIGKSKKPRCFGKIKSENLPVMYRNNTKAWMNSLIFKEWFLKFDRKMKRQNRKVILFLDNAPCHPHFQLDNIKLQFFPPNTTSLSQPMDQGIIQCVKLKYRKKQLQFLIKQMDKCSKTGSEILKDINILRAIFWINKSWNEVEITTIFKCFHRCGFNFHDSESVSEEDNFDEDDEVPLSVLKLSRDVFGIDYNELHDLDCNVATCDTNTIDWDKQADEILDKSDIEKNDSDDTDSDNDNSDTQDNLSDAHEMISRLKKVSMRLDRPKLFGLLMEIEDGFNELAVAAHNKQSDIRHFFKTS